MSNSGIESLIKALEVGMYGEDDKSRVQRQLKEVLSKLGIKSARSRSPMPSMLGMGAQLQIEDLEATMKQVTFDVDKLKLWPTKKK